MSTVAGTTPYPWPWHGRLDPARLALLAVSCPSPHGRGGTGADALATAVRAGGGLVVSVRVRPPASARRTGSRGLDAVPGSGHVVVATGWDGFHGSGLDDLLRAAGRDLLLLTGCCLETGVHSTMRAANDRGYECLLVADACHGARPELRPGSLSTIEMSGGIFGAVGHSTAVLAALAAPASTVSLSGPR